MLPEIFSYGPFTLKTINVFVLIAFFLSAFIFWRKGREEHYKEESILDAYLLSALMGVISARIAYILLHSSQFGFSVIKWFDLVGTPGLQAFVGLVVAGVYLFQFAQKHKWDPYEILDFWVLAVAFVTAIIHLGLFFDGTAFGKATNLPWGVIFPGLVEAHHPLQLYSAGLFLVLYGYLSRVEYKYRTFEWYRIGTTAQTGFLLAMCMIWGGLIQFGLTFLKPTPITLFSLPIEYGVWFLVAAWGVIILLTRAGKIFHTKRK